MPKSRRGRNISQIGRTGAFEFVIHPQSTLKATWPGIIVGHLVRGRAEITLILGAVLAYASLSHVMPEWGVYTTFGVAIVAIVAIGPVRRYVTRRYWCVVVRHRARACFRSTWTMTYDGTLPYLLWARPTSVGERIRVWLPAGLSVDELESVTDKLAAACWAREARVDHERKCAASAVIHIIRRDPLESGDTLTPDVLGQVPQQPATTATVTPLPSREQASAQVVTPIERVNTTARSDSGNGKPGRKEHRNGNYGNANRDDTSEPTIVGYDGTDVSDYV
jgi:hypothetical protein